MWAHQRLNMPTVGGETQVYHLPDADYEQVIGALKRAGFVKLDRLNNLASP